MFKDELINKVNLKLKNKNIMHSPAQLAYAGDAVYEMLVRSYIINNHDCSVNLMHKEAVRFVKAHAQANIVRELEDFLTEEEKRIVKRGRNAKVTSSPKNADLMEYRYATGFEALFGYLYLNKEVDRMMMLFEKIIEIVENKDKDKEDMYESDRGKKSSDGSFEK